MRTPWCCSYFSLRPRRIDTVSSTVGSSTKTGWKRRASAASFSTCLRYSSRVVAPTQCSSPRASAGFRRFDASMAPSALPAPTRVCISSMNRMMPPSAAVTSGQHGLEPLLELAAILRAGDQRAHVEGEQLLVLEALGHVAVDDAQRQALDDRGLADAGLADQHRVVLGAPGQDLDGAADLLVAADHRVELAVARRLGEVAGIFLQRVVGVLGRGVVGGAALAERVDGGVEALRRDARLREDAAGLGLLLDRQREQHALDRDEAVAGLLGRLLGGVEEAHQLAGRLRLRGGARDLRLLGEPLLDRRMGVAGAAAGPVDEAGAQPFGIVEQHLQDVAGRELRVALAHGERLRRLHEAPGPLGVFLEIHVITPSPARPSSREARRVPLRCRAFRRSARIATWCGGSATTRGGTASGRSH